MPFHRLFTALLFLFAWTVAAPLPAQDLRYFHPEKYERATKADDAGMLQWAEMAEMKCLTCAGTGKMKCSTCERFKDEVTKCIECQRTKEAVCRACGGLGHFADPLEKALCPGCQGASFVLCGLCGGSGDISTEGSGDRSFTCPACRGDGGWKCAVCDGQRLVEVASLKPSLKEANSATLAKALAATEKQLEALGKFTPTGGKATRKELKELVKHLAIAQQVYPPLKKIGKFCELCMSKTAGGAGYLKIEEREVAVMSTIKQSAEYYLKHQKRMLDLAMKRAEANEKLAAENKGK